MPAWLAFRAGTPVWTAQKLRKPPECCRRIGDETTADSRNAN
jgi:hypothetical protein